MRQAAPVSVRIAFFFNLAIYRCYEVFADVKVIYFKALRWIMNVWSSLETLKPKFFEKTFELNVILNIKWIKHRFLSTICIKKMPGVGNIVWNQLELLYWIRTEIGAEPPFHNFFYYSS